MKIGELMIRIAIIMTRLSILALVVIATIIEFQNLRQAGILYLVGGVSVFVIGICAVIAALVITKEKN